MLTDLELWEQHKFLEICKRHGFARLATLNRHFAETLAGALIDAPQGRWQTLYEAYEHRALIDWFRRERVRASASHPRGKAEREALFLARYDAERARYPNLSPAAIKAGVCRKFGYKPASARRYLNPKKPAQ